VADAANSRDSLEKAVVGLKGAVNFVGLRNDNSVGKERARSVGGGPRHILRPVKEANDRQSGWLALTRRVLLPDSSFRAHPERVIDEVALSSNTRTSARCYSRSIFHNAEVNVVFRTKPLHFHFTHALNILCGENIFSFNWFVRNDHVRARKCNLSRIVHDIDGVGAITKVLKDIVLLSGTRKRESEWLR
jgi:hypothetical protein